MNEHVPINRCQHCIAGGLCAQRIMEAGLSRKENEQLNRRATHGALTPADTGKFGCTRECSHHATQGLTPQSAYRDTVESA